MPNEIFKLMYLLNGKNNFSNKESLKILQKEYLNNNNNNKVNKIYL